MSFWWQKTADEKHICCGHLSVIWAQGAPCLNHVFFSQQITKGLIDQKGIVVVHVKVSFLQLHMGVVFLVNLWTYKVGNRKPVETVKPLFWVNNPSETHWFSAVFWGAPVLTPSVTWWALQPQYVQTNWGRNWRAALRFWLLCLLQDGTWRVAPAGKERGKLVGFRDHDDRK